MNFITLKISIFYGYTKPLQSDAKWRLIHSLYSFWQLLYTWLAWICSCKDIHCIVQCKVFEQATVECRQHIPANRFEILSFWNAMFIFLPRELDFSCKLFFGGLDWNLQTWLLYFTPAASISDEIVETLSSNGVILENKTIHTPPPSPPFKNGVLMRSTGSSNCGSTTLHGGVGDAKLYFLLSKLANC